MSELRETYSIPTRAKSAHPKRVVIRPCRYPNPDSYYVININRPHRKDYRCEYHRQDRQVNRIIDLVGREKFFFELDGGEIELSTLEL
jgi:hypothetical protein